MTAVAYDRRLQPMNFRIPFFIAQHINEKTGKTFPTRETIADLSRTSVATVKRTVKRLEETGYLKIRRNRIYDAKTKTWKTRNVYWLQHSNVQTMFDTMAESRLKRRYAKRVIDDPLKRVTHDPHTPSDLHAQKGGESSEGEACSKGRELTLVRVLEGGRTKSVA
jgi:hypothetical protein